MKRIGRALAWLVRGPVGDERPVAKESPAPTPTRRYPLGRVEFKSAHELRQLLAGSQDITTVKVIRPGDSGPVVEFFYLPIRFEKLEWLPVSAIQRISELICVEEEEVLKAVLALCSER